MDEVLQEVVKSQKAPIVITVVIQIPTWRFSGTAILHTLSELESLAQCKLECSSWPSAVC